MTTSSYYSILNNLPKTTDMQIHAVLGATITCGFIAVK